MGKAHLLRQSLARFAMNAAPALQFGGFSPP